MTSHQSQIHYVPWLPDNPKWSIKIMNAIGAKWLMKQPGPKTVVVNSLQRYRQNDISALTRGANIVKPQGGWVTVPRHSAVLVAWPTKENLAIASDLSRGDASSICILPWGNENRFQDGWLRVHRATSVINGTTYPGSEVPLLDPVVEAAMTELEASVNHNNALGEPYEKPQTIELLRELVRNGHLYNVDDLCAWSLAHGFESSEISQLRVYAAGVLEGKTFRAAHNFYPSKGAIHRWRAEAATQPD